MFSKAVPVIYERRSVKSPPCLAVADVKLLSLNS